MRKCIFLFLLLVFVLAIASITENRERVKKEVVMDLNNSDEVALQTSSSEQSAVNNLYHY